MLGNFLKQIATSEVQNWRMKSIIKGQKLVKVAGDRLRRRKLSYNCAPCDDSDRCRFNAVSVENLITEPIETSNP